MRSCLSSTGTAGGGGELHRTLRVNDFRKENAWWSKLSRTEIREREKKLGVRKIIVGVGPLAAKAAYDLGAGYHTCWRIFHGLQDYYHAGSDGSNYHDKDTTLSWSGRPQDRSELQKASGFLGKRLYVGTGIEGARKAQEAGASPTVARRIKRGLQDCVIPGGKKAPRWERTGFKRAISEETLKWIRHCANRYRKDWMEREDVGEAEQMAVLYLSATDIPVDDERMYALKLIRKCIRILTMRHFSKKRRFLSLDITGSNTEHTYDDGYQAIDIDSDYLGSRSWLPAPDAGLE